MRPAVHASILRNRSQRSRRVTRPHTFSMRRLLLLACIGSMFFIPGIVLTIVGLEMTEEELQAMIKGQRLMYQAIGPALTSLGVAFLFSACVYYYCFGTGEPPRLTNQKSFQSSINSDSLHHHHSHQSHHHHHGHHNGSQLTTPDGVIRRLSSCKSENEGEEGGPRSPHPHSPRSPKGGEVAEEEQVFLASSEQVNCGRPHSPLLVMRVDPNPGSGSAAAVAAVARDAVDKDPQEQELLVNGDVPFADSTPA